MRYRDEYRDPVLAARYADALKRLVTRPWTIMEICGGQTHAIVKFGIDELLPEQITLVHGPGCPVCVTPVEMIDKACEIAARPGVILCSFGDMLRVPGSTLSLLHVKARGGDVRIVYAPTDAVKIAEQHPDREVVFFAVGFETTAPANALAAYKARSLGLANFSMLVSHVLVPPAIEAILSSSQCRVQGFLAAGHVCTVMGAEEYSDISRRYNVPIVITGFEPLDILLGVTMCVRQLEEGRAEVENPYSRVVRAGGNPGAQELIRQVFRVVPRRWRGIGDIPKSGFGLTQDYAMLDAEKRFGKAGAAAETHSECIAGLVLQGLSRPADCTAFGSRCTPETPFGAPMVSSEGACAAYYHYRGVTGEALYGKRQ